MQRIEQQIAVHHFRNFEDVQFDPADYSRLKFGSDQVARKFGYELADVAFSQYGDVFMANKCVVIPSPYNYVKNAASVMSAHFVDRLNHHLVHANGEQVEWSVIHRKVTYTQDYGFLPADQRQRLIDNDQFHFNSGFIKGKTLLFIDDVFITGTHENKLKNIMDVAEMSNRCFFLYYGKALPGIAPETEAALNFSAVKSPMDYIRLMREPGHHTIVRPIKYLLGLETEVLKSIIEQMEYGRLMELYHGCLGEGYFKMPNFHDNFQLISQLVNK